MRKPGKLPFDTHAFHYDLEYGTDTLEIHRDGIVSVTPLHLALTANDWAHRWLTVFEQAGLPTPSGLQARLDQLEAMAEAPDPRD